MSDYKYETMSMGEWYRHILMSKEWQDKVDEIILEAFGIVKEKE
jgi:hypothetical protein